jgi:hypothetical protein
VRYSVRISTEIPSVLKEDFRDFKWRGATIRLRQIHSKLFPINTDLSCCSSPLYGLATDSGCFVLNEAVTIQNNGVSDRVLNEYGAVGGVRIGRGSRVIGGDPLQRHVLHNISAHDLELNSSRCGGKPMTNRLCHRVF